MPAWRRAIRILRAADPGPRRRYRPCAARLPAFKHDRALALDIDDEEARGKLRGRAAAGKRRTGKVEGARGEPWIDGMGHWQRTLP